MWHVILQILAVIGIVLLVLLALMILTVLAVLFVPIRYKALGEKEADRIEGTATVRFLYPLLSFRWQRKDSENLWSLRLFGIKLKGSRKAQTSKTEKSEKTEKPEKKGKEDINRPAPAEAQNAENRETVQPQIAEADSTEDKTSEDKTSEDKTSEKQAADRQEKGTEKKARFSISGLRDKMENIRDNVEYYKERLTAEENKLFLKRTKDRILAVLKSVKPKVLTARVICGTGSPDTTGYVCAVYGVLYPVIEDRISFTADFENKVLDGSFFAKGKVRIATLLHHGIKILLDKQFKVFLKEMKRED